MSVVVIVIVAFVNFFVQTFLDEYRSCKPFATVDVDVRLYRLFLLPTFPATVMAAHVVVKQFFQVG
jgi:hypothetical protein